MDDDDEKFTHNKNLFEEMRRNAFQAQIDYGKWLIASLLLVHGGSIFAIAQLGKDGVQLFLASGPWFVAGIMFALLAGMFTWFNFNFAINAYNQGWVAVVNRSDPRPAIEPFIKKARRTMQLAIAFALLSASMIVIGAWQIFEALQASETTWWSNLVDFATRPLTGK